MVTRAKDGIRQPNPRYHNLSVTVVSPVPRSVRSALSDPHWLATMHSEYDALVANRTWTLVPRPPGANIITGKWVFRHKFLPDGSLDRYKSRWVVSGFAQHAGVDFSETFSPVVKPATIRVVLQLAASRHWPVHQLNLNNAILYGHL